jgi:hypothetical protein
MIEDAMHLDDDEREQLDTQIEWLCSVANDCRRVTEDAMISECRVSEQYNRAPKGTYVILCGIILLLCDIFSSVIFIQSIALHSCHALA